MGLYISLLLSKSSLGISLFLSLPSGSICLFSLFLFNIDCYTLLNIHFKLSTLPSWQLIKFKLKHFSIILIDTVTNNTNNASLLIWSQHSNAIFELCFLFHGHLLVTDIVIRLNLFQEIHRLHLLSRLLMLWLNTTLFHLLHLFLDLIDFFANILLTFLGLQSWFHWLRRETSGLIKRLIIQIREYLVEVLLNFMSFVDLFRLIFEKLESH